MIPVVPPLVTAGAQAQTNQLLYNAIPYNAAPQAPFYLPPLVPHHPTEEERQRESEDGKDKNAFEEGVLAAPKTKNKRIAGCYKQWSASLTLTLLQQGGLVGHGYSFLFSS